MTTDPTAPETDDLDAYAMDAEGYSVPVSPVQPQSESRNLESGPANPSPVQPQDEPEDLVRVERERADRAETDLVDLRRLFQQRGESLDRLQALIVPTPDQHVTHVERDTAGFYWWCERSDCEESSGRFSYEGDAEASGRTHEGGHSVPVSPVQPQDEPTGRWKTDAEWMLRYVEHRSLAGRDLVAEARAELAAEEVALVEGASQPQPDTPDLTGLFATQDRKRRASEFTELFRKALMRQYADTWTMDEVSDVAHICGKAAADAEETDR